MEKLIALINAKAAEKARGDNDEFNAMDWSGGNFDDAYSIGTDDGEIFFARQLKALLDTPPSC